MNPEWVGVLAYQNRVIKRTRVMGADIKRASGASEAKLLQQEREDNARSVICKSY